MTSLANKLARPKAGQSATQADLLASFIIPNWPAPANVKALQTTRIGGISQAPYASLNLAAHVGDHRVAVAHNRQLLNQYLPSEPVWINQIHGIKAIDAATAGGVQAADAAYTAKANVVCVTMTADCLPVLLCDEAGTVVAAIHAGWKGLLDGVIENTINTMQAASRTATNQALNTQHLMAWLGPAIGPQAFEVGSEVRATFIAVDANATLAFKALGPNKWLCDLFLLARQRLNTLGVTQIYGGNLCTYTDATRFYSYRRDHVTGRMASLIWLTS